MTSSLVGSEMCIRDSLIPDYLTYNCRLPLLIPDAKSAPFPGAKTPFFRAVSYTHLTLPTICSV
eukprot:6767885-Prorocentrum_lima.AAC.1